MVKVKNPIKEARTYLGLSQEHFALKCGTSKQAVIRAEQGCYAQPPPAIMKFLRSGASNFDLDEAAFLEQYRGYQRGQRKQAYGMLTPIMEFRKVLPSEHPFVAWREGSSLNQTQVCKFWCLHPAIIFKFERQPHLMNDLPDSLVEALLESGYRESFINELRSAYHRYKTYLAGQVTYGADG